MWHFMAFATLGFLIGQLAGMTASSVTSTLLGLLFAFGGGTASIVARTDALRQRVANRELTKESVAVDLAQAMDAVAERANQILAKAKRGEIASDEAYRVERDLGRVPAFTISKAESWKAGDAVVVFGHANGIPKMMPAARSSSSTLALTWTARPAPRSGRSRPRDRSRSCSTTRRRRVREVPGRPCSRQAHPGCARS